MALQFPHIQLILTRLANMYNVNPPVDLRLRSVSVRLEEGAPSPACPAAAFVRLMEQEYLNLASFFHSCHNLNGQCHNHSLFRQNRYDVAAPSTQAQTDVHGHQSAKTVNYPGCDTSLHHCTCVRACLHSHCFHLVSEKIYMLVMVKTQWKKTIYAYLIFAITLF